MYLAGYGIQTIANTLTAEGYPTVFGGDWHPYKVGAILDNEKYCGDLILQKTYRNNHIEKKKLRNTGQLQQVFIEDDHEAIIKKDVFRTVAEKRQRRSTNKGVRRECTALTGMIRCPYCGKNYRRKSAARCIKWCCATFNTKGKKFCPESKMIPEDTVPQYYIANDHEAIIPPEKFKMVQDEMKRREEAGWKAQCVSIFSARIVCGDCGGFYGRKVWHAGSKYASWRWHCNNKFQKRKYCSTPTLKEESFKDAFVEVFNGLIKRRDEIEENYKLCLDALTNTSEYERQLEDLNNGCAEVQQLIHSLLITNGKQSDEECITEKYKEYEARLDTFAKLKQELDMKIAACSAKRTQVKGFLRELKKHDQPLADFDNIIWQSVIHHARVDNDCTITFVFRDGTEVKTPIKNGVKQYKKRKREAPDDE